MQNHNKHRQNQRKTTWRHSAAIEARHVPLIPRKHRAYNHEKANMVASRLYFLWANWAVV